MGDRSVCREPAELEEIGFYVPFLFYIPYKIGMEFWQFISNLLFQYSHKTLIMLEIVGTWPRTINVDVICMIAENLFPQMLPL